MKRFIVGIVSGFLMLGAASSYGDWQSFEEAYISGKLELGFRVSTFEFDDSEKFTYNDQGIPSGFTQGISVYELDARNQVSASPYIQYKFTEYIALLLTWEHLEGRARTFEYTNGKIIKDTGYDGDLTAEGPAAQLMLRYPNESIFTPYGGIGIVWFSVDFDESKAWSGGGQREMFGDNTEGVITTLGCSIDINEQVAVDLMGSYISADSDAYFKLGDRLQNQRWDWPLDSWVYSIGTKFMF